MSWSSETLLETPQSFFDRLIEDIVGAQQSIDIEMYIFRSDGIGQKVLDALKERAASGVQVRVLVDGIGSPTWSFGPLVQLPKSDIETRIYNPAPWPFSRFFWSELRRPRRFFYWLAFLNRRNHKKVVLIDEKIAYTGGINLTDRELDWRDVGVRLEGGDILSLCSSFQINWDQSFASNRRQRKELRRRRLAEKKNQVKLVRLNNSRPMRRANNLKLIGEIRHCSQRVWLTTAYFIPSLGLLKALGQAVRCGRDVRILLSRTSDIRIMPWISRLFFNQLLRLGVRLYLYKPAFIHSKFLLIDDWALLGSSNLNFRSRLHDLEADVVLQNPQTVEKLSQHFQSCLQNAEELDLNSLKRLPLYQALLAKFSLLLKRWF